MCVDAFNSFAYPIDSCCHRHIERFCLPCADCSTDRAVLMPPAGDGLDWQEIGQILAHLDNYHDTRFPIVEIMLSTVPCASGCCNMALFLRPNTTDITVIRQLTQQQDMHFLRGLSWEPTNILDAGANFGVSSMLFALLFPDARIVSLEPAPSNFKLLQLNSARFGNIHPLEIGLWNDTSGLQLIEEDCNDRAAFLCGYWGYKVQDPAVEASNVLSTTMADLSSLTTNGTGFQLVKIDIEGSEARVLREPAPSDWLQNARLVAADIHSFGDNLEPQIAYFFGQAFNVSRSGRYHLYSRDIP